MREWLKAIRKSRDLQQRQVAVKAQISQTAYCMIERGKRRPSVEAAKRIGAVLGFDWTLFFEEGSEE